MRKRLADWSDRDLDFMDRQLRLEIERRGAKDIFGYALQAVRTIREERDLQSAATSEPSRVPEAPTKPQEGEDMSEEVQVESEEIEQEYISVWAGTSSLVGPDEWVINWTPQGAFKVKVEETFPRWTADGKDFVPSQEIKSKTMALAREWVGSASGLYNADAVQCWLIFSDERPDAKMDPEAEEFLGMEFFVNKNNSSGMELENCWGEWSWS